MAYIVKQANAAGRIYVHLAENRHVPELKQARQSRKHLGVLNAVTGELLLAKSVKELTPEVSKLLEKAGIPFCGARASTPGRPCKTTSGPRPVERDRPAAVEDIGEMHTLIHVGRELGLERCLSAFEKDGLALLVLAIWQVCTGDAQYLAEPWLDSRVLPAELVDFDFSSPGMSALMARVGGNRMGLDRFFRAWIMEREFPQAVIYDTTSISTYSEYLEEAEWGYNRDKEALPQINLAMVTDGGGSGLPLAFRLLPGSISDVATLQTTGIFLTEYGLKNFSYSLDRGFFSNSNMRQMLQESLRFVVGVPLSSKQAIALAQQARQTLQSSSCSILYGDQVIRQTEATWEVDMATKENPDAPPRTIKAFVYLDPERAAAQTLSLERKLIEIERMAAKQDFIDLHQAEQWRKEHGKHLARYFHVIQTDSALVVRRQNDLIDTANATAGLALYAAHHDTEPLTAEQSLSIIRGRDAVEKIFDVIKNDNDQSRLHTGNSDVAQGRIFLAFLSAILRTQLENHLRHAKLNKKWTTAEVLAQLRKIRTVRFESGRKVLLEIPKKTRDLLHSLNIPEPAPQKKDG